MPVGTANKGMNDLLFSGATRLRRQLVYDAELSASAERSDAVEISGAVHHQRSLRRFAISRTRIEAVKNLLGPTSGLQLIHCALQIRSAQKGNAIQIPVLVENRSAIGFAAIPRSIESVQDGFGLSHCREIRISCHDAHQRKCANRRERECLVFHRSSI